MVTKSIKALVLTAAVCFFQTGSAFAIDSNVTFEGTAQYRLRQVSRNSISASGSVDRLVNYGFDHHGSVRTILFLSRGGFVPGRDIYGATIAQSSAMNLEPRSFYSGISMQGNGRSYSGRYKVVLLAIRNDRSIIAYHNFRNVIGVRKSTKLRKNKAMTPVTDGTSKFHLIDLK